MAKKDNPLEGLTPGSAEWQAALNAEIAKHDAEQEAIHGKDVDWSKGGDAK